MAIKPQPASIPDDDDTHGAQVDEPMAEQASTIADTANVDSITAIIQNIGRGMNTEKAKLAVALLNTTNYAVQLQGRSMWNTRDFMSFGVALAALAQISADPSQSDTVRGVNMDKLAQDLR